MSARARGRPPEGGTESQSFLFRLARTPTSDAERASLAAHEHLNFPDPIYGQQLQDQGVTGLKGEGRPVVTYADKVVTLAGGETVTLRVPSYAVTELAYGPLDPATTLSPRIAQSLPGMGLLEAIPEAAILAQADLQAKANEGVHGHPNRVRNPKTGASKSAASAGRRRTPRCARRPPRLCPPISAFLRLMRLIRMAIALRPKPPAARCRPACRSALATRKRPIRSSSS